MAILLTQKTKIREIELHTSYYSTTLIYSTPDFSSNHLQVCWSCVVIYTNMIVLTQSGGLLQVCAQGRIVS